MPDLPHHRQSIRLQEYDYRLAGAYFVTIVTQGRQCLFGEIANEEMHLYPAGQMVERWWHELAHKFPQVETDEFIVMPNHFHGIIVLVGAPLVGALPAHMTPEVGAPLVGALHDDMSPGAGTRPAPTLGEIVGAFKSITTNAYIRGVHQLGWRPFPAKLWQRNYYEHIVRNDQELDQIRAYILNNPLQWSLDPERPMKN